MITISVANIFALYIAVVLSGILVVSLYGKKSGKVLVKDRDLFNCPVCAYRYIINIAEKIHRCPQCESLNDTDIHG